MTTRNKIDTEIKDHKNSECSPYCDGGIDCYNSGVSYMPEKKQKALCRKCQCSYCIRGTCPASITAKKEGTK